MSASANTRSNHHNVNESSLHYNAEQDSKKTVAAISVTARIDYIQRFSKHMTVVVDKSTTVYSQLARQYLAHISQESSKQERNVAFVAASSKLNDIQMRCRLIEQLFSNTLFDPEQSLAVSVLRLVKPNSGSITIVVEHAQSLSLQVKYELCQLVDVAKKTNNNINVAIFGLEQAAQEIGQNSTIFDKKTSILCARSGQVFALDHGRFKGNSQVFKKKSALKLGIAGLCTVLLMGLCWFVLTEHNNFSLTTLPITTLAVTSSQPEAKETVPQVALASNVIAKTPVEQQASVSEINNALLAKSDVDSKPAAAELKDVLQALALSEQKAVEVDEAQAPLSSRKAPLVRIEHNTSELVSSEPPLEEIVPVVDGFTEIPMILDTQYYLDAEQGYVGQIAGFSDLAKLQSFIAEHPGLRYFSYERQLNGQVFMVLTTKIFSEKSQARSELNTLPATVRSLGSFIKTVSIIKREINTVNN